MFKIYGKPNCPFCTRSVTHLEMLELRYEYIDLSLNQEALEEVKKEGHTTVPVIKLNGTLIGGYTELKEYLK